MHRPALVAAALTALRAYIVAGQPQQPHPVMGSFEDWSHRVRDALTWLGEADPLGDTDKMEDTDPVRVKLRALLLAWHGAFKSVPSTCAEAVAQANETQRDETGMEVHTDPVLHETLTEFFSDVKRGCLSSQHLGDFITKYQRRIECGARFEAAGKRHQAKQWRGFITDGMRFETEKGEHGEHGEPFSFTPREKHSCKNQQIGNDGNSAKSTETAGNGSPCSPCSPYSPVPNSPVCRWDDYGDRLLTRCAAPEPNADKTGCANCGASKPEVRP